MVSLQKRHNPVGQFTHEWLADGIVGSITDQGWIHFARDFIM